MPAQIFGAEAVVTILNRAFNDISPSNATFNNQVTAAGTTTDSWTAFAKTFGAGYAGLTADALSTKLLNNIGVTGNTALQAALKDYITAAGVANVGVVALQLGQLLSGLENATGPQAGFAAAAVAWNNEITSSYQYSSNPANTAPSNPGSGGNGNQSSFVLTTGNDNIKSSSTEKTVVGIVDTNNSVSTLNAGDVVTGTGVDGDVLRIIVASSTYPGSATIKDIDRIEVQQAAGGNFVATGITGAKEIISVDSVSAVTVQNVASLDTVVGVKNSVANFTANWEPSLLNGTSDAVTVSLDNATGGGAAQNVAVSAGVEVINVKAVGTASDINQLGLTAANPNFKTVNVAADVAVRIRDIADTVTKIDASASTAGVRIAGFGAGTDMTITGGKGNDRFTFDQDQFTAKDTISGGEGVDRLDLSLNNSLSAKNAISGIETISLATIAAATLNLSGNTDIKNIIVRDDAGSQVITLTNVEAPLETVTYDANHDLAGNTGSQGFDSLTVNLAPGKGTGTSDSTTVNVGNGGIALATGNSLFVNALTLNGVENVTLKVADGNTELGLFDTALKSLTVSGDVNAKFTANLNSAALTTVDASALTKALTINTQVSNQSVTISLGNGNNDVTFGDGDNSGGVEDITLITLGTGSNIIREEAFAPGGAATVARAGYAVVTGFDAGVGGDAFAFGSTILAANATFKNGAATAVATSAAAKLVVVDNTAANGTFAVSGNDEVSLVNNFKTWAALGGVTFDDALVAQDSDTVIGVRGNDDNTYFFRLDTLNATAGIEAGDTVELIGILSGVDASKLVLNNFVL